MAKISIAVAFFALYFSGVTMSIALGQDMDTDSANKIKYLTGCSKKMSNECGMIIYKSVFIGSSPTIECCRELMKMGKKCHDALVDQAISIPQFHINALIIRPVSKKVWGDCTKVVKALPVKTY